MIVVDFTVLACLFISGPRSVAARRSLASDAEWMSASIWRQQFLDALSEHMLLEGMTLTNVLEKLAAADFTMRTSHDVLSDEEVLTPSLNSQILASQAVYVLVARRLGAKLITADSQIATRFPAEAVSIDKFAAE